MYISASAIAFRPWVSLACYRMASAHIAPEIAERNRKIGLRQREIHPANHAFVPRDQWASLCARCNLSIAAHPCRVRGLEPLPDDGAFVRFWDRQTMLEVKRETERARDQYVMHGFVTHSIFPAYRPYRPDQEPAWPSLKSPFSS